MLEMSCIYHANVVSYARTKLPSMFPNVEALAIRSFDEVQSGTLDDYDHWYAYNYLEYNYFEASLVQIDSTPMVPDKFLHLKYLHVCFAGRAFSPAYDYLSLVSFFDASPLLETFILSVSYCS